MRLKGYKSERLKGFRKIIAWSLPLLLSACMQEEIVPVAVRFDYTVVQNDYSIPVAIQFANRTTGAENYQWTFEGGDPATSDEFSPGTVTYSKPGTYTVRLEAWGPDDRQVKEMVINVLDTVNVAFTTSIAVNNLAPVTVTLENKTTGGTAYHWKFPGGIPASFTGYAPPAVVYAAPGDYRISLVVENGLERDSTASTITVLPGLAPAFAIEPSFADADYEAPLTAALVNKSVGGLTWQWSTTGGSLAGTASEQSSIHFEQPGTYTVTLTAANGKDTQTVSQSITVKANTGIYTMTDVKLGINTAHAAIGSFYSTKLRSVVRKDDPDSLHKDVDIVFFGLSSSFSYNAFVSPDTAQRYTFDPLVQPQTTRFVNSQETCNCGLNLTPDDFDQMTTDAWLKTITVPSLATGLKPFTGAVVPRIVLFQTQDGRRGAIKIKAFQNDGLQSYILVDIKVQKL